MDSDLDEFMQGIQDRRLDTTPEPVHGHDLDISSPNILEESAFRNRRSPIIVEFGKEEIVILVKIWIIINVVFISRIIW